MQVVMQVLMQVVKLTWAGVVGERRGSWDRLRCGSAPLRGEGSEWAC